MARKKSEQPEVKAEEITNREKALMIKQKFNAKLKKNILQTYVDSDDLTIPRQSSGILSLDMILGQGHDAFGWPRGRVIEIYGPESVGKTSIILASIAQAQSEGRLTTLIDAENAYDPSLAAAMGVQVDELLVSQPDNAEEGLDLAISLAESGEVGLIVIDSVAMLIPEAELEGSMEDSQVGLQARLISKFLRKITGIINKNDVTLLIVNQLTTKIGGYGLSETTLGGKKMRYAPSVRLEVRRTDDVEEAGNKIGHIIKCKTVKNKTAAPQKTTEIRLDWGKGFNRAYCLINLAMQKDIIIQNKAWYNVFDEQFQGKNSIIERIESDPDFSARLEQAIKESV